MRKRSKLAMFVGLLTTSMVLCVPQIAQAVTPDPNWNEIIFPDLFTQHNVMCLDDPGGSTKVGQILQVWHCHGSNSTGLMQRWQFIPEGTDSYGHRAYLVRNVVSNLCLDWGGNEEIIQDDCPGAGHGGDSTMTVWIVLDDNPIAPAQYQLEVGEVDLGNPGVIFGWGQCMAVDNASDSNGTTLGFPICATYNDVTQLMTMG